MAPAYRKKSVNYIGNGGWFFVREFFELDYKNSDSAHIQFGSMVFEVSPCSKKIKGKFSGYGSVSKAVVGGDISLEKNPS